MRRSNAREALLEGSPPSDARTPALVAPYPTLIPREPARRWVGEARLDGHYLDRARRYGDGVPIRQPAPSEFERVRPVVERQRRRVHRRSHRRQTDIRLENPAGHINSQRTARDTERALQLVVHAGILRLSLHDQGDMMHFGRIEVGATHDREAQWARIARRIQDPAASQDRGGGN